jgi:energy-coupling factor transporter transmembrane protein EcfT
VLLLLAYFLIGSGVGIETRDIRILGGAPPVRGLAYEHDLFGSTCAAAAVALFSLLRTGDRLFRRRVLLAGFWVCVAGTVVAQARAAYVALAVCLVLAVLLSSSPARRLHRGPKVGVGLLLVGLLVGGLVWASVGASESDTRQNEATLSALGSAVSYQVSQSLNLSSGTGAHRLAKYEQAIGELLSSPMPGPVIGRGTNSWGQRHFHPSRHQQVSPSYLESLYMRTFYDSGFLGLALLMGFLLFLVWPIRAIRDLSGQPAAIARALTLSTILLLITYSATDSTLLIWPWVLFGLNRAARRLSAQPGLS